MRPSKLILEREAAARDTRDDGTRYYTVAPRLRAALCDECVLRPPADSAAARRAAVLDAVEDGDEFRSIDHDGWCRVERAAVRDPHAL